ncbi:MAG: CCC motif membrane protein [Vicingaceae bacterium]|jgi:uncharacterized protein MpPF26|nr:MAG: hypothetical protein VR77_11980 [Flavobacteriales bacterium BRH_c54]MBQ19264.1 hypothetical protein [Flavobacteriales bacterium]MDF1676568.1 CCC motif membrane protein [Vicingaceae bacterium]|tara:strand:+ start:87403 stop:87741 length:339 start_codon:yes stop_codon:yes gene_type:complete
MENQNLNTPQALPNSTAILVLGILSIVLCFCYGIIGLALGIVAIVLANKAGKLYKDSPSLYTEGSYKNMKAGRVCAIVGVSLSALYLLYFIIVIIFYGAILTSMPWDQIMNP